MEYFVDTADLAALRQVNERYPIEGLTTNPNLLAKAGVPLPALLEDCRGYVRETGQMIFVQVTAKDADEMLAQAEALRAFFGENLVVKLPAVEEGYRACLLCKARGIRVCVTVIHSVTQALMAARAGADYAAPYVTHIDNNGADGVRCVEAMVNAFERYGSPCKVLGASFRTADQILRLAGVGCHAVTITPEMFRTLIAHPSTDASLRGFDAAWRGAFGDSQITDFLPRV